MRAFSPNDVEDVAVDALVALVPKVPLAASPGELVAVLHGISKYKGIDFCRASWAQKRGAGLTESLDALQNPGSDSSVGRFDPPAPDTDELPASDKTELRALLQLLMAVAGVDERTRTLFREYICEESPGAEVAKRHGLTEDAVRIKVFRGIRRIRQELKKSPELMKRLREFLR